jgi:hypothetical protein
LAVTAYFRKESDLDGLTFIIGNLMSKCPKTSPDIHHSTLGVDETFGKYIFSIAIQYIMEVFLGMSRRAVYIRNATQILSLNVNIVTLKIAKKNL